MIATLNSIAQNWFAWQWAMLWQSAVLVGIVALLDRLMRKWAWPQLRYALWLLILVKLVLPPSLTSPVSLTSAIPTVAQNAVDINMHTSHPANKKDQPVFLPAQPSMRTLPPVAFPIAPDAGTTWETPQVSQAAGTEETAQQSSVSPIPASQAPRSVLSGKAYLLVVWFLGVTALAGGFWLRLKGLRKEYVYSSSEQAPAWLGKLVEKTARELHCRQMPTVVLSNRVCCPAVFGLLRPVLLIPADRIGSMRQEDARHILLHELAHIKRGDLWGHSAYMALVILYWCNPLVWLMRKHLQNLRELCCDATVARHLREDTQAYRGTLLETARELVAQPVGPGLGMLGLFENSNWLVTRLQWLQKETWRYRRTRIITISLIAAIMLICILPMAQAKSPEFTVRGRITDARTGEPIVGASVGDANDYAAGQCQTQTDSNGQYRYKTWYEEHSICAKAADYTPEEQLLITKPFAKEKERIVNFKLQPVETSLAPVPESGPRSDALFDRQKTGANPSILNANFKSATERELGRSIQTVDGVLHARVQLVLPGHNVFANQAQDTKATVMLKMKPGHALKAMQVSAITQLVANSVPGLETDCVTLVDSEGKLLSGKSEQNREGHNRRTPIEAQGQYQRVLPSGVSVELMGICDYPMGNAKWWKPNGHPWVDKHLTAKEFKYRVEIPPLHKAKVCAFKIKGGDLDDIRFSAVHHNHSSRSFFPMLTRQVERDRDIHYFTGIYPQDLELATIKLVLATGPWKEVASTGGRTVTQTTDRLTGQSVVFQQALVLQNKTQISASQSLGWNYQCRLVARDHNGMIHESTRSSADGGPKQRHVAAFDVGVEEVLSFELQARPYEWIEFADVALRRNAQATEETPNTKLQLKAPEYEWWLNEPDRRMSIQQGDPLEIEWKIDQSLYDETDFFAVGVFGDDVDVSENQRYKWLAVDIPTTVRKTAYGKAWPPSYSLIREMNKEPAPLEPGSYRIVVFGFEEGGGESVGDWPFNLKGNLQCVASARLIVKSQPELTLKDLWAKAGATNLALNRPVTSSAAEPILGELSWITDGNKEASNRSLVELPPFSQHVTIDLEQTCEIYAIQVWHYYKQQRVYLDVVIQVARDGDANFASDVQTLFNNDDDNSSGLGTGSDRNYIETSEGKLINVLNRGVQGRYVRLYSNGSNAYDENHYLEVEVYGKPAARLTGKPVTTRESSRPLAPGDLIETRDTMNKLLQRKTDEKSQSIYRTLMAKLSKQWLFEQRVYEGDRICEIYVVKPGDSLSRIGDRFKLPHEFIMELNGIDRAHNLRAGQVLKLVHGPFDVRVRRSDKQMDLYLRDMYVKSYDIALGRPGHEAPAGLWQIKAGAKLVKPDWTDPETGRRYAPDDPAYPLGARWIGLKGVEGDAVGRTGFAIHGIKDAKDMGEHDSRGCIVLKDRDAIQLFNMLVPEHSIVEVID